MSLRRVAGFERLFRVAEGLDVPNDPQAAEQAAYSRPGGDWEDGYGVRLTIAGGEVLQISTHPFTTEITAAPFGRPTVIQGQRLGLSRQLPNQETCRFVTLEDGGTRTHGSGVKADRADAFVEQFLDDVERWLGIVAQR